LGGGPAKRLRHKYEELNEDRICHSLVQTRYLLTGMQCSKLCSVYRRSWCYSNT